MTYIVDTHPLVWFLEGNPRLSTAAQNAFIDATAQIVVPTFVQAEITFLYARHRITIDLPRVLAHMASGANCLVYTLAGPVVERQKTREATGDVDFIDPGLMNDVESVRSVVLNRLSHSGTPFRCYAAFLSRSNAGSVRE